MSWVYIKTERLIEGFRAKRAYIAFWADFHFLQDRATFWQIDLFWHEKHLSKMFLLICTFISWKPSIKWKVLDLIQLHAVVSPGLHHLHLLLSYECRQKREQCLQIKWLKLHQCNYPGWRDFRLFFLGKFFDANRFFYFFYWHEALRAEKRKLLVKTVGILIFMPSAFDRCFWLGDIF